jgi:hypothetical protein
VRVGAAVAVGIVVLVACDSNGPDEPCPAGGTSSAQSDASSDASIQDAPVDAPDATADGDTDL